MNKAGLWTMMLISSFLGGVITLTGYHFLWNDVSPYPSIENRQNAVLANFDVDSSQVSVPQGLNFIHAAHKVRPAVVHIKTTYKQRKIRQSEEDPIEDMFRQFHGDKYPIFPRQSSGSGVILTDDGFIATNYHVIDNAHSIEVILNDKRSYTARLIGTDRSTDLALLKINEKNLPFVKYGNADKLEIGEWVLAVGNPLDLTSTVTAGIISAKGRNIDLLKDEYAIEAFIQTDAAVNPGNSGGALVNLKGELIGINTAIATQTGYYAGYSFAVPVNIVKKVMDDLMNFGETQRALLGVKIHEVDAVLAKEKNLKEISGVYILGVIEQGSAYKAGIREGDVIQSIGNEKINSPSELQTVIATQRPGQKVNIKFLRNSKQLETVVILQNKLGNTHLAAQNQILGASLGNIPAKEKQKLGISDGVKVMNLIEGKMQESGIQNGFIITQISGKKMKTPDDVIQIIQLYQKDNKTFTLEGIYPQGKKGYYIIGWWEE
jgi:serine protease Do